LSHRLFLPPINRSSIPSVVGSLAYCFPGLSDSDAYGFLAVAMDE
jgi:hypothetical protein